MNIEELLDRKAARTAALKQQKQDRLEETGSPFATHLIIERSPTGIYTCRYPRGNVPEELKGAFTSKARILGIAARRGIPVGE